MRFTWIKTSKKLHFKVVFCMGYNNRAEKEYNDIVQFSFKDSYYNLTILTLLLYNWTLTINKRYDYLIKADSDVYPNLQLIVLFSSIYISKKRRIYGYFYPQMYTNRNRDNKNYIPFFIYPYKILPGFVAGNFYIFPNFLGWKEFVKKLTLKYKKLVYREDIQLGIYLKINNIRIKSIKKYYNRNILFKKCKDYQLHLAVHEISIRKMTYIHFNC